MNYSFFHHSVLNIIYHHSSFSFFELYSDCFLLVVYLHRVDSLIELRLLIHLVEYLPEIDCDVAVVSFIVNLSPNHSFQHP